MTEASVRPDIRPTTESREREVSRFVTPARSHILTSVATGDRAMLHPDSRITDEESSRLSSELATRRKELDFNPLADLTKASRSTYYEGKPGNFDQRKTEWIDNTQEWIAWKATKGDNQETFREAMSALGITDIDHAAQTIYEQFLDNSAGRTLEAGLRSFTQKLLDGCRTGDGPVDMVKLAIRLEAIGPFLNAFGTEFAANHRVEDYIVSAALLTQSDQQPIANELRGRLEVSDDITRNSLIKLSGVDRPRLGPIAHPSEPTSPTPTSPETSGSPATVKSESSPDEGRGVERKVAESAKFHFAANLNTEKDEDGPPLSQSYVTDSGISVSVASVADGLGGSGSRKHKVGDEEKSSAYIASRAAQEVIKQFFIEDEAGFVANPAKSASEIQRLLKDRLAARFDDLSRMYPLVEGQATGMLYKDFPTTLSTVVIREEGDQKHVMLFWKGDSPLIVLTPDNAYSTITPGAGDAVMSGDIVFAGNQETNVYQMHFPKDVPVLVLAASDGMLKLGASKGQEVREIIDFVFGEDMYSVPIEELERKLQEKYQQRKIAGLLDEYDDTTLAVISSIPPGTDFSVFEGGLSKIETILPLTEAGGGADDPEDPSKPGYFDKYFKPMATLSQSEFEAQFTDDIRARFKEWCEVRMRSLIEREKPSGVRYPDTLASVLGSNDSLYLLWQKIIAMDKDSDVDESTAVGALPFSEVASKYLGITIPDNYHETFEAKDSFVPAHGHE